MRVDPPESRSSSDTDWSQAKPALDSPSLSRIEVLYDCPDATADICFVHGLEGDARATWTADGKSAPWPEAILPQSLEKAGIKPRILTYGYDAYIVRRTAGPEIGLADHAAAFLHHLAAERATPETLVRPLILVSHNLGGTVCKEALLQSNNAHSSVLRGVFDSTAGIVFMGMPHAGCWVARWAKVPLSLLGLARPLNTCLLATLNPKDTVLESVQRRFKAMIVERTGGAREVHIMSMVEQRTLPGLTKLVVSKKSATMKGFPSLDMPANHRDMVKFGSAADPGFETFRWVLVSWLVGSGDPRRNLCLMGYSKTYIHRKRIRLRSVLMKKFSW